MRDEIQPDIHQRGGEGRPFDALLLLDHDDRPLARTDPAFLSFALDTSQLVGGHWWDPRAAVETNSGGLLIDPFDFDRPQLDRLVRALAPACLRLGGSEADRTFYDVGESSIPRPDGYRATLTHDQWRAVVEFARRTGVELAFTLNAGPGPRCADGSWDPANAETLLRAAAGMNAPVRLWELGNELNIFFVLHGLRGRISPAQYSRDLAKLRTLLDRVLSGARLGMQGSAFWPQLGELPGIGPGFLPRVLRRAGELVDVVTWHYYPQQSRRAPIATRRAHPARLLDPAALDEAGRLAEQVNLLARRYAPGREVWLGESGNAQNGGEPGVSDVYISSLWYLDQLGQIARAGQAMSVRQTLCGSDYGMLADDLTPRPDYWAALLWKRLMGPGVHHAQVDAEQPGRVRAYLHAGPSGGLSALLINLHPRRAARFSLAGIQPGARLYMVTTPDVLGGSVYLNGAPLSLTARGEVPDTPGAPLAGAFLDIPPLAYAFVHLPI